MNRKIRYWIIAASAVCAVALCTAAYRADFKLGQNIELIVNMMRGLFTSYVDEVDVDKLGKNAAAGMVSGLDPYTELIHADDMDSFELATTGKYGGIGAMIRQKGDYVQIAEPYKGSPSDRAGLEIGDAILAINGKSAKGMTTEQVSAAMRGEAGTTLRLKVRKFYTGKNETVTIRREVIAIPAIPYYGMAADSIGYIHHSEFTDGCADEFRNALVDLKSQGAKALVLDYRGNGGGIMQEAVKIIAMFVPKGTEVVSMRGRTESSDKQYFTETEPSDVAIPVAVLVDGQSASAAEIVAGAFQDLDRGVIIGQKTFGKGLVQSTLPLGYNSWLKLTTAKYYTPSGRCIQAIDYSHSGETNGTGAPRGQRPIPDSLIREFHTAGGRKVYDGGGIMPDVRLAPEYSSRFAFALYAAGYIDDYADHWSLENRGREVLPATFALSDADWEAFVAFIGNRETGYEPITRQALDVLRESAEAERYLTDEMDSELDRIAATLDKSDNNAANLALHRAELSRLIEDNIILRRWYSQGVSEHNLVGDTEVAEALAVLRNGELYRKILTSQDTERK